MANQELETLLQSVAGALSKANNVLRRQAGVDRVHYAISELEISAQLSQVAVGEKVHIDTEVDEEKGDQLDNQFIRFKVVPQLEDQTLSVDEKIPELEANSPAKAVEVLIDQGFSPEQIQLAFEPNADVEVGTVTSYDIQDKKGLQPPNIVFTIAGSPSDKDELSLGDIKPQKSGSLEEKIYRKLKKSDTWHFCANCPNYPTENYITHTDKPASGEFCNECLSKSDSGNCE